MELFSRMRAGTFALLAGVALLSTGGCSTNPATGESSFTAFMSPEEEQRVGREEHPKILAEFGGEYPDPKVKAYVNRIGNELTRHIETPGQPFTFTVLNSPVINAFALPGGYVYITRGILALAEDEAEVASVVGHEIGHVVARHTAQRYSQAVLGNIGMVILGVATGNRGVADLGGQLFGAYLQSFSREQEFEADLLGIRYLGRDGYDTRQSSEFLTKLDAHSKLEAAIAGRPEGADRFNIMSTHPRTADRVEAARQAAAVGGMPVTRDGQNTHFAAIDGMIFGDDPAQGLIKGRQFIHPELRFRFEVPPGYRLINGQSRVAAQNPNGSIILFDAAQIPAGLSPAAYLRDSWAARLSLGRVETIEVNGLAGATGATRVQTQNGPMDLRLVVVRGDRNRVYRFQFATPTSVTGRETEGLQRTTYSFRTISAEEAAGAKPQIVRIVTARSGDTQESVARQMAFETHQIERLRLLNGLAPGEALKPGQRLKIVVD